MPETLYTLDKASVELLRRMVHQEMRRVKTDLARSVVLQATPFTRRHVGKVTTEISAASGTTPGSGTISIAWLDPYGSSDLTVVSSSVDDLPVKTLFESAIPVDSYVMVDQDTSGTFWVASGLKPLIRFTLTATLATTDASKSATIQSQYGMGFDSPATGAGAITVHNLLTATASVYTFAGASGRAGLAYWDSGTNYRIINMQC